MGDSSPTGMVYGVRCFISEARSGFPLWGLTVGATGHADGRLFYITLVVADFIATMYTFEPEVVSSVVR